MIGKGVAWGREPTGPPDVEVAGGDTALARAASAHPGQRVRFRADPSSDFARAVGIAGGPAGSASGALGSAGAGASDLPARVELPCDLLRVGFGDREAPVVNMVVVGVPPDRQRRWSRSEPVRVEVDGRVVHDGRATAVVVANGQYLRGVDVVPRGHPGDGRAEVHVYALTAHDRAQLRRRLARGEHLPNPRIVVRSGVAVRVSTASGRGLRTELDGVPVTDRFREVSVEVLPDAFLLLV